MSWKLRWAGHNRGKVRVYREDGSYFYGDPSKYPPQEPQYTEEEKRQLKELEEQTRKNQAKIKELIATYFRLTVNQK